MSTDEELTLQLLRPFFRQEEQRVGAVIPRRSERRSFGGDVPQFDLVAMVTNPVELLPVCRESFSFTHVSVARETARTFNEKLGISLKTMKAVEFYFSRLSDCLAGMPANDTEPLDVEKAARAFDALGYDPTTPVMTRWLR